MTKLIRLSTFVLHFLIKLSSYAKHVQIITVILSYLSESSPIINVT